VRNWATLLKRTAQSFGEDSAPRYAAALSYYTVFSLPPLVVLLLLILGAVLDPQDVQALLEGQVGELLGPAGSEQVRTMMEQADRPGTGGPLAAVLGVGALLFGAVGAFVELQNALNRMWEVAPDPERGGLRNFVSQRLASFGMLLTLAFLLLVSLLVSAILAAFGDALGEVLPAALSGVALQAISFAVSLTVIALLFALLFRFVPDAEVAWRDTLVGGLVTAVLFTMGQVALSMYLGQADPGQAFGAAGALALLLVWIYYSAIIVLLGAEFTQVWATRHGEGIRPSEGAVRIIERKEVEGRGEAG
jgi:membrane protein